MVLGEILPSWLPGVSHKPCSLSALAGDEEKELWVVPGLVLQWRLYLLQFPQMPTDIQCPMHF